METERTDVGPAAGRRLDALADDRRRQVLSVLCEAERPLSLTGLAVELMRAETATAAPSAPSDDVRELEIQLYHRHVPKLASLDLVTFDREQRTVALAPEFDDADEATELLVA